MATVSASLRMFDQMTRPLQQVTQALNVTISAMEQMNNAANTDVRITNSLNIARESIRRAGAGLQELASEQDRTRNNQDRLNDSFNRGSTQTNGLMGKVKGLVAAYLGFKAVKEGLDMTIGGAMRAQQQLFTIQGIMGNKDVGTAYFENLRNQANKSTFAFEDFANNARKFMQFTKSTDSLDKLSKLSERLTLMDPTQGLDGAGFALKEAMSGDFISLKERFGFGKADAEILKASKGMDDFISKFDMLLSKKGFTEDMLAQYNKSAAAQFNNLKSNVKTGLANAGQGALEGLMPIIIGLNNAFSSGSFQPFFDGVADGLVVIVETGVKVIDVFKWIGEAFQNNWGMIEPIIWGIVAAMIAYKTVSLVTNGIIAAQAIIQGIKATMTAAEAGATFMATVAQHGLNAALYACPLTWIIIIIIALIAIFYAAVAAINHFAGTSISATGIIAGVFASLGAFLYNVVAYIWNYFASLAEFLINVFNNPVYSVKMLFANLAFDVLDMCIAMTKGFDSFATNLANAMIDGINKALGAWNSFVDVLNKFGGIGDKLGLGKATMVGHTSSITSSMENAKADINSWVGAAPSNYTSIPKMGMKSIGGAYNAGYKFGENVEQKFDLGKMFGDAKQVKAAANIPNLDAWNKAQGIGELSMAGNDSNKHLKNIDDKIDISNEHLEMMRDLAEHESIQNFVTLTPTVQVTTGDIKEEADIDKIIAKIETYMEDELASTAEGVYT